MDEQYRRGSVEGDANLVVVVVDDDDERVSEWEAGLPNLDDLTPLSQLLIPRELATAFSISPEPYRTLLDVTRASDHTISSLRANSISSFRRNNNKTLPPPPPAAAADEEDRTATMMMIDDDVGAADSRKLRTEEADSALRTENSGDDQSSARALKRPRLVWTPQLHKRFVEVVIHLGINNAVPKTVMQMMNVDGLTRENVASHLQKYRLFLKRRNEGPAISDHLFPSEPYPNQPRQQQHQHQQQPPVMHMVNPSSYHPFDTQHHFNMMQQQQHQYRDWSSTSNYASLASPAND
ncbi:unnamed protein product [Rhodiola kirilowii]